MGEKAAQEKDIPNEGTASGITRRQVSLSGTSFHEFISFTTAITKMQTKDMKELKINPKDL